MVSAIAFTGEKNCGFFFSLFFNIHVIDFLVQLHSNYICATCFMHKKYNPEWFTVTGQ